MNYELIIMHYKLNTNELWMDYKVINGNPCEWTIFIMWPCPILAFLILWQRKIKFWLNLSLRHDVSWQGWNTFPHKMGHVWELFKKKFKFSSQKKTWGEESHIFKIRFQISNLIKINDLESFKGSWKMFTCWTKLFATCRKVWRIVTKVSWMFSKMFVSVMCLKKQITSK